MANTSMMRKSIGPTVAQKAQYPLGKSKVEVLPVFLSGHMMQSAFLQYSGAGLRTGRSCWSCHTTAREFNRTLLACKGAGFWNPENGGYHCIQCLNRFAR